MRYRMPDVFMAGFDSAWPPPPQRGQSNNSIGYDLFDRFDLGAGTGAAATRYGNENTFRIAVNEFHKAGCRVFVDWLMNHNGVWDNSTMGFISQGGYPGFVLEFGGDPWGDFHAPGTQSENPGGPNYNLFEGRLVGLIDIAQEKSHPMIRHPIVVGDPNNIPAGTIWNKPDANNRRFYPDTNLAAINPNNPGTNRNPSPPQYTYYPFDPSNPSGGDPVMESATNLLLRSTKYYLEVLRIDGFRLDAAKHIPTWFWDNQWDAAVYNRYAAFDGTMQTPYSFVEAVGGGGILPHDWVRKPGEPGSGQGYPSVGWQFGNRDMLDLDEAGALRDLTNNDGSGSWDSVMGASADNVDGFNNGTIGVHHVNSHDNAIADGENDSTAHAYVLMRTGPACVYHMALQFGAPPNNFPRRNGRDDALGLGGSVITTLVKLRNQYGRGWFIPVTGGAQNDLLIFTRRTPSSQDNVLIGLNDREDNGFDTRSVTTTFPQGTRLHEQAGNAANATVDPNSNIAEMLTVGAGGSVSVNVPRNRNANGVFHGLGYVIYGPAVPSGTLSIANASTTTVPPDISSTPDYKQRVSSIVMVTSPTFDLQLQTNHTDPGDPNTDDLAVFRIDQGFRDYNGNGSTYNGQPSSDYNAGNSNAESPSYGFENFLTQNDPRCQPDGGGNCQNTGSGTYRQTINAAALGEGYHYITVRAYRHRAAGLDPLFGEFRIVIYVDLQDPDFTLLAPTNTCSSDIPSVPVDFIAKSTDLSLESIYMYVDLPPTTDFIALSTGGSNLATQLLDTFTLRRSTLITGNHRLDLVAVETLPNGIKRYNHKTYTGIQSFTGTALGPGDIDADGDRDGFDIDPFIQYITGVNPTFGPAADMDCNGLIDLDDVPLFASQLLAP
jgi:glycosidase